MFPLKLVHSLVSGDNITNNPHLLSHNHHYLDHDNLNETNDNPTISAKSRNRIPLLIFTPTQEIVTDTYRLASIARAMGMDLHPNPSLSHIIFSWPSSPPPPPPSCWSLQNGTVPLPFPSFSTASLSHLRQFASLAKGYFKLAFLKNGCTPLEKMESLSNNNWRRTSLSLFSTRTGERIELMDGLSRALLGMGWTLFKSKFNSGDRDSAEMAVYLYRKMDVSLNFLAKEVADGNGDCGGCSRVRELRLPSLDFSNVPLRILQYILLMTDDVFYLA